MLPLDRTQHTHVSLFHFGRGQKVVAAVGHTQIIGNSLTDFSRRVISPRTYAIVQAAAPLWEPPSRAESFERLLTNRKAHNLQKSREYELSRGLCWS